MKIIRAILFWFATAAAAVALSGLTAWLDVGAEEVAPRPTVWRQA